MTVAARPPQFERGHALTEFALLGVVITPLLLGIPLLGKYLDLMHETEKATRSTMDEAIVQGAAGAWPTDDELLLAVRRNGFGPIDAPIRFAGSERAAAGNPLWVDAAGRPLVTAYADALTVQSSRSDLPSLTATALHRDSLGLSTNNLFQSTVTLRADDLPGVQPFAIRGLAISRKGAILTDAWTARNPDDVRARIEHSLITYPIGAVKDILNVPGMAPTLLRDPPMRVGDFDWEVVPCDRLVQGC